MAQRLAARLEERCWKSTEKFQEIQQK